MSQFSPTPEVEGQVSDAFQEIGSISLHRDFRAHICACRARSSDWNMAFVVAVLVGIGLAILADGQFALHDVWIFVSCAIGAFLMRGAGCTWNDITDRKIDGAVERTRSRPIPSGQVTVTQAIIWMILQAGIAH